MAQRIHDLIVVGGGINGAGIACDAAGRGLDVLLVEADDIGAATSSASSKLIHGGLRYLENYEFMLVRKALAEREVLLAKAPHIAWPLRFVLPHSPALRPRWMLRAGLFLYDHLARRAVIPGSRALRLDSGELAGTLRSEFEHGFAYWDGWADDARLVVLNARAAADLGATIMTRTRLQAARCEGGLWRVTCSDVSIGACNEHAGRVLVNAAGPWVDDVAERLQPNPSSNGFAPAPRLRLVKGSHIVVPRIHAGADAFILQNADGRVVFVLPYEQHFSLIGTTEEPFTGDPATATASEAEIEYLIAAVTGFFAHPPPRFAVVHTFAGVRPLHEETPGKSASAASRDYAIRFEGGDGTPPLVTVLGGKLTTYRKLAETVVDGLARHFPGMGRTWTKSAPLPGGDIPDGDFAAFVTELVRQHPGFPAALLLQLARRHGTRIERILDGARDVASLGEHLGHGLYEREVTHLRATEWARTADDILWRRTKIGLHMTEAERRAAAAAISSTMAG